MFIGHIRRSSLELSPRAPCGWARGVNAPGGCAPAAAQRQLRALSAIKNNKRERLKSGMSSRIAACWTVGSVLLRLSIRANSPRKTGARVRTSARFISSLIKFGFNTRARGAPSGYTRIDVKRVIMSSHLLVLGVLCHQKWLRWRGDHVEEWRHWWDDTWPCAGSPCLDTNLPLIVVTVVYTIFFWKILLQNANISVSKARY